MRCTLSFIAAASLIALAGCGGGGGKGKGGSELVASVAETRAFYQVLDIGTGSITAVGSISDIATNPVYKTTKIAFRQVITGNPALGGSGSMSGDSDEVARAPNVRHFYLALYETTRAQWAALGGVAASMASYHQGVDLTLTDINTAPDAPAVGVDYQDATTTLAAFNAAHSWLLRLPNEDEWEYACRAGSGGAFAWGNSLAPVTVAANARVWETANGTRGAAVVGSYAPNAWGFFDMHGNVWELCQGNVARGGSWNDSISAARCANRAAITAAGTSVTDFPTSVPHLLVGLRLVYVP